MAAKAVLDEGTDQIDQLRLQAAGAAELIWDDDEAAKQISDPRHPAFADHFIRESARHLSSAKGLIKKALEGASRGAEGTNIDPFHGLIEVIQNADDLRAVGVRVLLRDGATGRQLLVVHDGDPVTCHHVPGMMLPYITTKEDDPDQRGRFGIGLKTLRRISSRLSVHSAPYHFEGGSGISISPVEAEAAIPSFYSPKRDTMLVLHLTEAFDESKFERWFAEWSNDSLIFLEHVRSLRWLDATGKSRHERAVIAGDWGAVTGIELPMPIQRLARRSVQTAEREWQVWRALVQTPLDRQRSHKRTGNATPIALAWSDVDQPHGLFIGFPTRIESRLPFAIDAQFDPSTARETIIENDWNEWLIKQCGAVIGAVATAAFGSCDQGAWRCVPLPSESIGNASDRWPSEAFAEAFSVARAEIIEKARVQTAVGALPLSRLVYEDADLGALLTAADIEQLSEGSVAVPSRYRDRAGRWRAVLNALGASGCIGVREMIDGYGAGKFTRKPSEWWVSASSRLVEAASADMILGAPIWLRRDGAASACGPKDGTSRALIFGTAPPPFASRWQLFDVLHEAYAAPEGEQGRAWLAKHAAYLTELSEERILLAFVEANNEAPVKVSDIDLLALRDMLDLVPKTAAELGKLIGSVLLLDGYEYKAGKAVELRARADELYLPKAVDKDSPNWPVAAGTLPGIRWAANDYVLRIPTGLGRARKRSDGIIPRGARQFLTLLGVARAPRLQAHPELSPRSPTRQAELAKAGANRVQGDWISPDLDRVVDALAHGRKKDLRERRERSLALLRALSREWPRYGSQTRVQAEEFKRTKPHPKGTVTAHWLCRLRDEAWVAVGTKELRKPGDAAIKNRETQALFGAGDFVTGLDPSEVDPGFASAVGLTNSAQVSSLIESLRRMRDGELPFDIARVRLAYNLLSRSVPKAAFPTSVGDLSASDVRSRFAAGRGLVAVATSAGIDWRRPNEVIRGPMIFPEPERFAIEGVSCMPLWSFLSVREPSIGDCQGYLLRHAAKLAPGEDDGPLIEVYRYIETRLARGERTDFAHLKIVPLACGGTWQTKRPIFLVSDPDLGGRLATALPEHRFWSPPSDAKALPLLGEALGVSAAELRVKPLRTPLAAERGQDLAEQFSRAVAHLSDSLGRSGVDLRKHLRPRWEELRAARLFVYDDDVRAEVQSPILGGHPVQTAVRAVVLTDPLELHFVEGALEEVDSGGRLIASLFATTAKWPFDEAWVAAWQRSARREADDLRFRSDDAEIARKLAEEAAKISVDPTQNVKLRGRQPSSKENPPLPELRRLKVVQPGISNVEVNEGKAPPPAKAAKKPRLSRRPPDPSRESSGPPLPGAEYNNLQLEQYGWDVLKHVIETGTSKELVDFRRRHRVGADGAIDWSRFVELKATGRSMQSNISMSAAEFARADRHGEEYVLALIYGAEEGHQTKVKLIFNPTCRATVRETEAVRLGGLGEASGVTISFGSDGTTKVEDS